MGIESATERQDLMRGYEVIASNGDDVREKSVRRLKWLVWLYLILLVVEGSIRKWVPPLSSVFLVIRDPVALAIWYTGGRLGVGSRRIWHAFYGFALVVTVLGLLQLITSSLQPAVIVYGWRCYVLHLPVAIVLSAVITERDLRTLGRWTLAICPLMTLLMGAQYLSPGSAWINAGVGDGGGQISGALDHIRPAGTFSYNTGPGFFFPIALGFVFWGLWNRLLFPRWLVWLSGACILVTIPISVSRSLAITCVAVVCISVLAFIGRSGVAFNPQQLPRLAVGAVVLCILSLGLYQVPVVADAVNTFTVRWTSAQGQAHDNSDLEQRSSNIILDALGPLSQDRLLGRGIGAGSAVASSLEAKSSFEFGEGALEREMYELGPPVGIVVLLTRLSLTAFIFLVAFRSALRGNMLPIFLSIPTMIGVCAAPVDIASTQGFIMVMTGILFASIVIQSPNMYKVPSEP